MTNISVNGASLQGDLSSLEHLVHLFTHVAQQSFPTLLGCAVYAADQQSLFTLAQKSAVHDSKHETLVSEQVRGKKISPTTRIYSSFQEKVTGIYPSNIAPHICYNHIDTSHEHLSLIQLAFRQGSILDSRSLCHLLETEAGKKLQHTIQSFLTLHAQNGWHSKLDLQQTPNMIESLVITADMTASKNLRQTHGDSEWHQQLKDLIDFGAQTAEAHEGIFAQQTGDGFVLIFPDAYKSGAIGAMEAIQARNKDMPSAHKIRTAVTYGSLTPYSNPHRYFLGVPLEEAAELLKNARGTTGIASTPAAQAQFPQLNL